LNQTEGTRRAGISFRAATLFLGGIITVITSSTRQEAVPKSIGTGRTSSLVFAWDERFVLTGLQGLQIMVDVGPVGSSDGAAEKERGEGENVRTHCVGK
jgi:hypothetical protein